jgi:pimeloyl-ACP methyl ester carboxylesterase
MVCADCRSEIGWTMPGVLRLRFEDLCDMRTSEDRLSGSGIVPVALRYRRPIASGVLLLLLIYLGSCAWVTWRMTRRHTPLMAEFPPQGSSGPIETLRLSTEDGEQIGGWLTRGTTGGDCVLLLHANGESRRAMLPLASHLQRAGCTTLAISFRAHGDSSGEVNDFGYGGRHDVLAAVAWLEREFPRERIFIVARSLGAAAAIFAAKDLGDRVTGYLLEAPYKDLHAAVWYRLRSVLPPPFDRMAFWGVRLWAPAFLGLDPTQISPWQHVASISPRAAVTLLFGSRDRRAPLDDGRQLATQMRCAVKIIAFEGAGHCRLYQWDRQRYEAALDELFDRGRSVRRRSAVLVPHKF